MFVEALIFIARTWKQLICPIMEDWVQEIYTMYNFSGIKNDDLMNFVGK